MFDEAVHVLLSAFQREAFTAAWLDLSRERLRRIYARAVRLKFTLYLEAGHPIQAVVENGRVIGLLVMKFPYVTISKTRLLRSLLPLLPRLVGLVPSFIRSIPIGGATKPPGGLPENHCTLEAMAVHPLHQGKGIGRLLLEKAKELACADETISGIYLFTGDEKNYLFYRRYGYQLIEKRQTGIFTSYHMLLAKAGSR